MNAYAARPGSAPSIRDCALIRPIRSSTRLYIRGSIDGHESRGRLDLHIGARTLRPRRVISTRADSPGAAAPSPGSRPRGVAQSESRRSRASRARAFLLDAPSPVEIAHALHVRPDRDSHAADRARRPRDFRTGRARSRDTARASRDSIPRRADRCRASAPSAAATRRRDSVSLQQLSESLLRFPGTSLRRNGSSECVPCESTRYLAGQ